MNAGDSPEYTVADAEELNRRLRDKRNSVRPSADSAQPASPPQAEAAKRTALQDDAQFAADHWSLSEPATLAGTPSMLGRLARVPLIGGLLAFSRELYGSLWLKAHRRSPIGQQITLNYAVARAINSMAWYVDDLDQLWVDLDRELQATRSGVGILDDDVLHLQRQLVELTARVAALESELRALHGGAERRPIEPAHVPGSTR
jgi:hypothetical protein